MRSERYATNIALLTGIPGVGPLTSLYFLLEIGDVNRFAGFDQLNNFVGFYPGSSSSGEKQQDTGISKRRHKMLRSMLVEASWVAVRRDPAMYETYKELLKRMKGNAAIVRIARKLLRRMRNVLISRQPYEIGVFG